MDYRSINKNEIALLEQQGCVAEDWSNILVKEGFNPKSVSNTRLSGEVKLGNFNDQIDVEKGVYRPTGIYHSFINNCSIDDNCLISNVRTLSNYNIAQNVVIDSVGCLTVTGESSFGNGEEILTLNESGGRELLIFDALTAQMAYVMVMYRHDSELVQAFKKLVHDYSYSKKSHTGIIEENTRILNTTTIKNVQIGHSAKIEGVLLLENGTICSSEEAPTIIGHGVSAKNFIIHSDTIVDTGANITNCFVGQGVRMGKYFTAENSVFFANCDAFQSEACSIFAGPYTVTHHKSTLLIAGMFSFYNAGSGTNQSNHMYKLGPVHQGILERGTKTGSFSYLLWPSRTGAFSVIIGKHYSNFDSSDLPFSYINESEGKTKLTPAFNLCTVGTKRDSQKWPKRDRRHYTQKLDLINFEFYNPYIIGKLAKGREILQGLIDKSGSDQEFVMYKGAKILKVMLKTGLNYYEMVMKIYIGNEILYRLGDIYNLKNIKAIQSKLDSHPEEFFIKWVDAAGMIVPYQKIEAILNAVKAFEVNSLAKLSELFKAEFVNYRKYAWAWCAKLIYDFNGCDVDVVTTKQLINIIEDWKSNSIRLNNLILKDAEKEFNKNSRTSFGIDGNEDVRDKDFEMVRGTFESNHFVVELQGENI